MEFDIELKNDGQTMDALAEVKTAVFLDRRRHNGLLCAVLIVFGVILVVLSFPLGVKLLFAAGAALAAVGIFSTRSGRKLRESKATKIPKGMTKKRTYRIDADGIMVSSAASSAFFSWNDILSWSEYHSFIWIFAFMQYVILIDKRQLSGKQEENLKRTLVENLDPRKI